MTAANEPAVVPSPATIESLLQQHEDLAAEIAKIEKNAADLVAPKKQLLGTIRTSLLDLVDRHGSAHAEKSRIAYGLTLEVMVTRGSSNTIDAAAVETFRQLLSKLKLTRLLKKIFTRTVRFDLAPGAGEIIRSEKLSDTVVAAWSRCNVPVGKSPRLEVRPMKKPAQKAG